RGPTRHAVEFLFVGFAWRVVVIHAPGDAFADAVEAQPVVAGPHRQKAGEILKVLQLMTRARREDAVDHAKRELLLAPELIQRRIILRREVVAARVDHAGQAKGAQFAKKTPRAVDGLLHRRFWQPGIERGDGGTVACDPTRRLSLAV